MFSGINQCTWLEVYSHNNSSREGYNRIIDWIYPPSHQLLPEILIVDPCQYFSKYTSQFIYCINITELDSVFYNFPTKPYGLISIMLSSRCELWWQGICQDQSSRIVLMNIDIIIFILWEVLLLFQEIYSCLSRGEIICNYELKQNMLLP